MIEHTPPSTILLKQNEAIIDFLEQTRLFTGVEQEFIQEIVQLASIQRFEKGTVLLEEGQPNQHLYLLMKGAVSIYAEGKYIYTLRRTGDIVGEMSLIKQTYCSATVIADDHHVEMLVLPDVTNKLSNYPGILYRIFTLLLVDKLKKTTLKAKLFEDSVQELQFSLVALTRAKEEAEAANKAKSDFLAVVSHEIRTPMNIILGMLNILMESNLTTEQQEYARAGVKATENLLGLINDILDFSKIESGHMELEQIPFSLEHLLDRLSKGMEIQASKRGLAWKVQIPSGTPLDLIGDPIRVHQVLMNLLSNAIKFTEKGEIAVKIELKAFDPVQKNCTLVFHVCDTGIGIPSEKMKLIFKAFTQVDSSTTRKYGGTGLGLAICKKLIEAMGGLISVESQPGQGSIFLAQVPFQLQETYKLAG